MSGIGNAYSDEILHVAKVSPVAHGAALDVDTRDRLYDATIGVIRATIAARRGIPIDQLKAAKVASMAFTDARGRRAPSVATRSGSSRSRAPRRRLSHVSDGWRAALMPGAWSSSGSGVGTRGAVVTSRLLPCRVQTLHLDAMHLFGFGFGGCFWGRYWIGGRVDAEVRIGSWRLRIFRLPLLLRWAGEHDEPLLAVLTPAASCCGGDACSID